jgi:hypothetical protein
MSVGVKVTLCEEDPKGGTVVGVVKAKPPGTDATPPVSVDEARVCPTVMALAAGHVDTVGVTLLIAICPVVELGANAPPMSE